MQSDRRCHGTTVLARLCAIWISAAASLFALPAAAAPEDTPSRHAITIEDVLTTGTVDRASISRDGKLIAVVVQRPAREGEAFGRTAYEVDPSRDDVWLISREDNERRNLTQGEGIAAGFWCATWSPDGQRLAMLSTKPEGPEPRGGNNVHIYVWERAKNSLGRVSGQPIVTQTRLGSSSFAMDVQVNSTGGAAPSACREGDENPAFAWLDNDRLLAVMLPQGETSALLDQYGRPFVQMAATGRSLRQGHAATKSAVDSLTSKDGPAAPSTRVGLHLIDLKYGRDDLITEFPLYPFQGTLSVRVAPDLKELAVLAPVGRIPPIPGKSSPYNSADWQVEKRLALVSLLPGAPARWINLPTQARYPLELFDWSPRGNEIVFRARPNPSETGTSYFAMQADSHAVRALAGSIVSKERWLGSTSAESAVRWGPNGEVLLRGRAATGERDDWWVVSGRKAPANLTASLAEPPTAIIQSPGGRLAAMSAGGLVELDLAGSTVKLIPAPQLPKDGFAISPRSPRQNSRWLVLQSDTASGATLTPISLAGPIAALKPIIVPKGAPLSEGDDALLWYEQAKTGSHLWEINLRQGTAAKRLSVNGHLSRVNWGETQIISYTDAKGRELRAATILPPGHKPGDRHPVIVWVYPGYTVRGQGDYYLDPYLPGLFNLQLYAAKGYVVLIPSIPLAYGQPHRDISQILPGSVLPAIDRLIEVGIADPKRIGLLGHSLGGYAVYSLITQTDRFSAAVALSGITDLTQYSYQFDPLARGYGAIEQGKSDNWSIVETGSGFGFGIPPWEGEELYGANSPLDQVKRVNTPLLLVHGELDSRGTMSQAETFFTGLYRQGKPARLLRYWGESHSLAQSPANIRDIVNETLNWFDKYMGPEFQPVRH